MEPLKIGGRIYALHYTTGVVQETGKNMETRVTGSGGGGATFGGYGGTAPVSIRSQTIVHDQLFVIDKDNGEHAFQLQDFNLACRTGQKVSVIWAIKNGKKTGKYIAVVNHSTQTHFYNEKALKNVFRLNLWLFLGVGFAAGWVYSRGIGGGIIGGLLALLVWAMVWDFARLRKFKETIGTDVVNDQP